MHIFYRKLACLCLRYTTFRKALNIMLGYLQKIIRLERKAWLIQTQPQRYLRALGDILV